MAGEKDDKKKKSKATDVEKVKKEKSDKEKKDKKDKKEKPEKSDKKEKDKKPTGDKLIDRKLGAEKKGQNGAAPSKAAPKPAPKPRGPPPPTASTGDNYLAGLDLPSSESESDDEIERRKVDESEKIFMARVGSP